MVLELPEAVHSTLKEVEKTGIKVLCFAQKKKTSSRMSGSYIVDNRINGKALHQ